MTPIYQGTTAITGCYRGTVEVSAIYRGTALVWAKQVNTPQWRQATVNVNPSVRSYSYNTIANGTNLTTTPKQLVRPSKVSVGDLLLGMVLADSGTMPNATTLRPTGWTEMGRLIPTTGVRFVLMWKVATAADTTATSFTLNSYPTGADGAALCMAIRDWSGTTSQLRSAFGSTTNSTTWTTPTITPATARSMLLTFISQNGNSGDKVWGYVPPVGAGAAGYTENGTGWCGGAVSSENITGTTATGTRTWKVNTNAATAGVRMNASVTVPAGTVTKTITEFLNGQAQTGGSGGALADTTNNTFVDSAGTSSTYHLFADGLDWNKKVGLLIYTDGSMEYGLDTPQITSQSPYLLYGSTGMIAVAKKHNMVLLTPRAPGNGCNDGDGVCWYDHSIDGTTPWQKLEWSNELIRYIMTQYDINRTRIAIGGYSSGAQWTMSWWGPRYGSEIMMDGVAVGISYGGEPRVSPVISSAYKANVEHVWDTGDADDSWLQPMWWNGVQTGRQWFQDNGFAVTDLVLIPGKTHDRYNASTMVGEFGPVMDREITNRVIPA